tara:strand:- start:224 stop:409 length:186 start_codon:yes stop_codon:yes gene_type:complete
MNPEDIKLSSTSKMFSYEQYSRSIGEITDVEQLQNIARSFYKLYLKQQETVAILGLPPQDQ